MNKEEYLKEINNDDDFLIKVAQSEKQPITKLIKKINVKGLPVVKFKYTQSALNKALNHEIFNSKKIKKVYQEVLDNGAKKTFNKYHIEGRTLKLCFLVEELSLNAITKNKRKILSKRNTKQIDPEILKNVKQGITIEEIAKKNKLSSREEKNLRRGLRRKGIKYKTISHSACTKEIMKQKLKSFEDEYKEDIYKLMLKGYSIDEIRNELNTKKQRYFPVKAIIEKYYLSKFKSLRNKRMEHKWKVKGVTNPMQIKQVKEKNRSKKSYHENIRYKEWIYQNFYDKEQLLKQIYNNVVFKTILYRKFPQNHKEIDRFYQENNVPEFLQRTDEKQLITVSLKKDFKFNREKEKIIDEFVTKYPKILKGMKLRYHNQRAYYFTIAYRIFNNNEWLVHFSKQFVNSKKIYETLGVYDHHILSKKIYSLVELRHKQPIYIRTYNGTVSEAKEEINLLHRLTPREINKYHSLCELKSKLHLKGKEKYIYQEIKKEYPNFYFKSQLSSLELKVFKELSKLNISFVIKDRKHIKPQEIDFYIPDKKIGIEINSTIYHNCTSNDNPNMYPDYHFNKRKHCEEAGITLISLYEDDLVEPKWSNFTKPFLKFKLKGATNVLYARETYTYLAKPNTVDRKKAINFINTFHEQGKARAKYYLIFKHKKTDEFLGVMSFSPSLHPQYKDKSIIELKRMVFKPNIQIRFGLSKGIKDFHKMFPEYKTILSYSNNDLGTGEAYQKAGFEYIKEVKSAETYYSLSNPNDTYSWQVATSWGAKSGILAKQLGSMNINNLEAQKLVETILNHKLDEQKGYVRVYKTGNKIWKYNF